MAWKSPVDLRGSHGPGGVARDPILKMQETKEAPRGGELPGDRASRAPLPVAPAEEAPQSQSVDLSPTPRIMPEVLGEKRFELTQVPRVGFERVVGKLTLFGEMPKELRNLRPIRSRGACGAFARIAHPGVSREPRLAGQRRQP
jgi:hypothetical protein